jgi:hypothetical protein
MQQKEVLQGLTVRLKVDYLSVPVGTLATVHSIETLPAALAICRPLVSPSAPFLCHAEVRP